MVIIAILEQSCYTALMDKQLQSLLAAVERLCKGEAQFLDAGEISIRLICPGWLIIRAQDRYYSLRFHTPDLQIRRKSP